MMSPKQICLFTRSSLNTDGQVFGAANRISQVSGYGYNLTQTQITTLNSRIKTFKLNGGLPDFYIDGDLSVNKNLVAFTQPLIAGFSLINGATLGTPDAQGWCLFTDGTASFSGFTLVLGVLPQTSYTISVEARSGTATQINLILQEGQTPFGQTINSLQTVTSGGSIVSATATNSFATSLQLSLRVGTGSGSNEGNISIKNIMLEVGGVVTTYQLRSDGTVVNVLNLGTKNGAGDPTYINGSSRNMQISDPTIGRCINFGQALSQGLQLPFADYYNSYTIIVAYRPSTLGGALFIKTNAKDRIVIDANGSFRFNGDTGLVQTNTGVVTNAAWNILAMTVTGTTAKLYKNGVSQTLSTNTLSSRISEASTNWSISTAVFLTGRMGEFALIPSVLSDSQILNIFNQMKDKYAL